jgi:hypothetical protein
VNECYNENDDDDENVDGKDVGNGGEGTTGHRSTRAPDRHCSRPWHLP